MRGGMIAIDLIQTENGKIDKAMAEKASSLLQKGRASAETGRFRAIAQVAFRRLQYQTGEYEKLLAEYKKELPDLPEAGQVGRLRRHSERQLGRTRKQKSFTARSFRNFPRGRKEAAISG